jgi:hypothetical protein
MMFRKRESTLRFAVIQDGKVASSIWRVWKARNKNDIYIAPRNIAGELKVSFHESGYAHLAVTKQSAARQGREIRPVIFKWQRPVLEADKIWPAASLLIAPEFLSPTDGLLDENLLLLAPPAIGKAYFVSFVFAKMAPADLSENFKCLSRWPVSSNEFFATILSLIDFDASNFFQTVNLSFRSEQILTLTNIGGPGLRALLYSDPNETGDLQLTDLGGAGLRHLKVST